MVQNTAVKYIKLMAALYYINNSACKSWLDVLIKLLVSTNKFSLNLFRKAIC